MPFPKAAPLRAPVSSIAALALIVWIPLSQGSAYGEETGTRGESITEGPQSNFDAGALRALGLVSSASSPGRASSEKPYRPGERPRPDGAVVASVADELIARFNVGGDGDPGYLSNRPGFHVAPRVLVEATVHAGKLPDHAERRGTLSGTALVAQARQRGYWPFRLCYEGALRTNPALRGKTRLRIRIGRDGRATSSRVVSSEIADERVAKCLSIQSRSFKFSPGPRRAIEANLSIDLNPGDAPLPDSKPATHSNVISASGRVDPVSAERALSDAVAQAEACYREALAVDPKLWGRISLEVDLEADGSVRDVRQYDSRFPASRVVDCVESSVRNTRFAAPEGGRASFVWAVRLGAPIDSDPGKNGAK